MRLILPSLLALLAAAGAPSAEAQPGGVPAARLPVPELAETAPPSAFVAAARTAIAAGRVGEATEAIERAESRLLVRSTRPSRAGVPSDQDLVRQLAEARRALAQGNRAEAVARLGDVAASPALDAQVE